MTIPSSRTYTYYSTYSYGTNCEHATVEQKLSLLSQLLIKKFTKGVLRLLLLVTTVIGVLVTKVDNEGPMLLGQQFLPQDTIQTVATEYCRTVATVLL